MNISSNWGELLSDTNVNRLIMDGFGPPVDVASKVVHVENKFNTYAVRDWSAAGVDTIPESSEGATTPLAELSKGYETVYTPKIFKRGVQITDEFKDWSAFPQIANRIRTLGDAAKRQQNIYGLRPFRRGFSTAVTSYGDALPLFSSVHTRFNSSSTTGNGSTTGLTLTEANLWTEFVNFHKQVDDLGQPQELGGGASTLFVPIALDKDATIITGSQLRSGGFDNDLNYYLGRFNVLSTIYLDSVTVDNDGNSGSNTAWHLYKYDKHEVKMIWDMPTQFKTYRDEDTDSDTVKVKYRVSTGWSHWRGVRGSKGDGAAWSS